MSAHRWVVTGTATVTVSLIVEAHTAEEALALAEHAMSGEWECDDVDGDVTVDCESPHREDL